MPTQPKRRRRTPAQLEQARRRREANRKYTLKARHRMTPEQYDALAAFQGGLCWICRRARGTVRSLSVDHDHAKARADCGHDHKESCEDCWRGLLCGKCNDMLGHGRDSAEFFLRAIDYLKHPPAHRWRLTPSADAPAVTEDE
jgi:hypothetical protein